MKKIICLSLALMFSNANAFNVGPEFRYSWSLAGKCSLRTQEMLLEKEIKRIAYCEMFIDSFKDIQTFRILMDLDKKKYNLMERINDSYRDLMKYDSIEED